MSALSGCESEKDSLLAKITTQTSSSHPDGWVVKKCWAFRHVGDLVEAGYLTVVLGKCSAASLRSLSLWILWDNILGLKDESNECKQKIEKLQPVCWKSGWTVAWSGIQIYSLHHSKGNLNMTICGRKPLPDHSSQKGCKEARSPWQLDFQQSPKRINKIKEDTDEYSNYQILVCSAYKKCTAMLPNSERPGLSKIRASHRPVGWEPLHHLPGYMHLGQVKPKPSVQL